MAVKHPFPGRLSRGSQGPAVRELQQQLDTYSGLRIAVDGDYGEQTELKVRRFQGHRGLGPDGIVDAVTWAFIFRQPAPETRAAKRKRLAHERAERRLQAKAAKGGRLTALTRRLRKLDRALAELAKPETRAQKTSRLRVESTTARGRRGRVVRAALRRLTRRPLSALAWDIAGQCVGIREVGHNGGADVDRIIAYAGGDRGEPYCVDGVIWSYGHAGSDIVRPGYPRAVSMMLVAGVSRTSSPETGDPVRFVFDHTGLFGYYARLVAGRYVKCPRALATHIVTREFNTSAAGALSSDSNDGTDGVHLKARALSLVSDFLRVSH